MALQHFAPAAHGFVAIALRRKEHRITVLNTGFHPVDGLLGVLFPPVLGDADHNVFPQPGIRIVAELHRGGDENAPRFRDHAAQAPMHDDIARKPRGVIDDHIGAGGDEGEHGIHPAPDAERAGDVVAEDRQHVVAAMQRKLAAARLLALEPVADAGLLDAGNPAINDGGG
nr:hypothetical protein [Aurantimonas sp. VKM B-3413]